jgi:serine/threonine protein kinase
MDAIDESWCPVVQVHGLLMHGLSGEQPRVGLLMERYGVSLYSLLHDNNAKKEGPVFDNASKRTVAMNVASACRYLHDVGMLHRDLKDQNVLVDPKNGFRCLHRGPCAVRRAARKRLTRICA